MTPSPKYFKVIHAVTDCGGGQAWVRLHPDGTQEAYGCICHHTLPADARIIGEYLDRPYVDDPMPLYDEAARKQWRRRNLIRQLGVEAYQHPRERRHGG